MKRRSVTRWLLVSVPLMILPVFLWHYWPHPREAFYTLYREHGKAKTLNALKEYQRRDSAHFEIWFKEPDSKNVDMILETAELVYAPVVERMGYQPEDRIPLIVYPDRTALRQAFGWGNGESAMGVYWEGTIRLLSPNAWLHSENKPIRQKVFREINPIAHEMTHYLLDYLTGGNYQRWFTEGLAQRVEHQVTGYLWIEPQSRLRQPLYSLDDLTNRFDQLDNQPLAYRQSYLLVEYMAQQYGEDQLNALVDMLAGGTQYPEAVEQIYHRSMLEIYSEWATWVQTNLEQLDPAV